MRLLSGGNMQKLILGRVMADAPAVILANQPTRGLDVGAVNYVHEQLLAARSRGAAILLISEDLDELLALSDGVCVMYPGPAVRARCARADDRSRRLGLMMAGQGIGDEAAMRLEPRSTRRCGWCCSASRCWRLLAAGLFCALLVMLSGASPFSVFRPDGQGRCRHRNSRLLETLTRATPLIFTGLAAAVAFRAKLWNIGGEAQLYVGAVMTVVLGTGAAAAARADSHSRS